MQAPQHQGPRLQLHSEKAREQRSQPTFALSSHPISNRKSTTWLSEASDIRNYKLHRCFLNRSYPGLCGNCHLTNIKQKIATLLPVAEQSTHWLPVMAVNKVTPPKDISENTQ